MTTSKKIIILFIILLVFPLLLAHSGRTDSRGGHRDNQNKSGLGSYHYHCGGHPPHLHDSGVCPYKSSSGTASSGSKPKSNKTVKSTPKPTPEPTPEVTPKIVDVTSVSISVLSSDNPVIMNTIDGQTVILMDVGSTARVIHKALPVDAYPLSLTWKASNDNISITSKGVLTANKTGEATLTLKSSNGIISTIKVNVCYDFTIILVVCLILYSVIIFGIYWLINKLIKACRM